MVTPTGMLGVDPQQLAAMQEVSQHITAEIRIEYKTKSVKITMASEDPAGVELIPQLLNQFAGALATQLSSFFAIKGEIVEVGKEG